MSTETVASDAPSPHVGKYLTFRLGEEHFGLVILKVREIIGLLPFTPIPNTPNYVRGLINLRGKVIPVIDLRRRLGMESTEDHDRKCIIVVDAVKAGAPVRMGVLVDGVSEVAHLTAAALENTPPLDAEERPFLKAVGMVRDRLTFLLDIDEVLWMGDAALEGANPSPRVA